MFYIELRRVLEAFCLKHLPKAEREKPQVTINQLEAHLYASAT